MPHYIIYFNQQWVGDHPEEWFRERGPLANAVVAEIEAAGEYVCAGGVDEDLDNAVTANPTSGKVEITDGPYARSEQYIGGLTIVEVADEARARHWAGRIAEAYQVGSGNSKPPSAVPRATEPKSLGFVAPYRSRSTWNSSRRAATSSRRASVSGVTATAGMPSGHRRRR
ncbi:YciI family protein [Parenemella sanctibonifatiensis]|uniref:YciI family protein n=1 Tax=Parenemella sanctibonifatiensis TaxID=2016505 RepID=UPI001E37A3E7|nr:YciI family protein [Parenemella sanctibonifatiensis]